METWKGFQACLTETFDCVSRHKHNLVQFVLQFTCFRNSNMYLVSCFRATRHRTQQFRGTRPRICRDDPISSRVLLRGQFVWRNISVYARNVAVSWYAHVFICIFLLSYDYASHMHPSIQIAEVVSGGMNQLTGFPPSALPPTLSTFH